MSSGTRHERELRLAYLFSQLNKLESNYELCFLGKDDLQGGLACLRCSVAHRQKTLWFEGAQCIALHFLISGEAHWVGLYVFVTTWEKAHTWANFKLASRAWRRIRLKIILIISLLILNTQSQKEIKERTHSWEFGNRK